MAGRSGMLLGGLFAAFAVFLVSAFGGAGPLARACAPLTGWRAIAEISPEQAAALRGAPHVAWLRARDGAPAAAELARYATVVVADPDRDAAFALAATLARSGVPDVRVLTQLPAGDALAGEAGAIGAH